MNKVKTFEPTESCRKCGGACCKAMPCHYSPTDFPEISFEYLKAEIEKGRIAIDWWEAEGPQYYLRARHYNEAVVHGSWGGVCVNLTEDGCSLPFAERPLGGRALRPRTIKSDCKSWYTKEQCKYEWIKYTDVLLRLANWFREHPLPVIKPSEE